jgi:hypothetical protein
MPVQIPVQIPIRVQSACTPLVQPNIGDANTDVEIKDLCSAITMKKPCPCLGYICDDTQRRHVVHSAQEHQLRVGEFSYISLAVLLHGQGDLKLTRHERYKVASILASSLLQLQSTPWLAEKMEKTNIFFCKQETRVFVDRPYIRHSFPSLKCSQPGLSGLNKIFITLAPSVYDSQ